VIFTVTLDQAVALLNEPKARGRRAAAGPLRELGADPVRGKNVVVRTGRFGPYVTDGEFNATLRVGDTPDSISFDRACELLAERRNADPTARRAPAKKARGQEGRSRQEGDDQEGDDQEGHRCQEDGCEEGQWGQEGGHRRRARGQRRFDVVVL
jgi:topoisomerase IA-like protein